MYNFNSYNKILYNTLNASLKVLTQCVKRYNNFIDLQSEDGDIICGLVWYEIGEIEELQIKALVLRNDILYAIMDNFNITYSSSDLDNPDENWYPLDGTSNIFLLQTVSNILENIDYFIDQ